MPVLNLSRISARDVRAVASSKCQRRVRSNLGGEYRHTITNRYFVASGLYTIYIFPVNFVRTLLQGSVQSCLLIMLPGIDLQAFTFPTESL